MKFLIPLVLLFMIPFVSAGTLPVEITYGVDNTTGTLSIQVDGTSPIVVSLNSSGAISAIDGVDSITVVKNVTVPELTTLENMIKGLQGNLSAIRANLSCRSINESLINISQIFNITQILNITGTNITSIQCNQTNTYNFTYFNNYNNYSSNGVSSGSVCPAVTLTPTACNCNNEALTASVTALTAKVDACSARPNIQSAINIPPPTSETATASTGFDLKYVTDRPWMILVGVLALIFLWLKRDTIKNMLGRKGRPPRTDGNPLSKQVVDDGVL